MHGRKSEMPRHFGTLHIEYMALYCAFYKTAVGQFKQSDKILNPVFLDFALD